MIGIFFLIVFGLWIVISITLGIKIPKWLGMKRDGQVLALATGVALLVFVAPVADEIIAYPQMRALCKQDRFFELVPGMDEKNSYGRTVYSEERHANESIFPQTVEVTRWQTAYVDVSTKEDVLINRRFLPIRGMLGVSNGSSGGKMTVLLSGCDPTGESFDSKGVPSRFSHLHLTKIPKP